MNRDAIGVFDSGMGGLTAVKVLNQIMPHENIIYFGDTARIPYGTRSRQTIQRYTQEDIAFLRRHPVKMIIAACGTVSSMLGADSPVDDMPFTGVVYPAARAACASTQNGRVGIIGTPATVASGSYEQAIHNVDQSVDVTAMACPLFVHLVEYGYTDRNDPITRLAEEESLQPIRDAGVDTLILGCTHYPVIAPTIADIMGEGVKLISASEAAANYAKQLLEENDLLTDSTDHAHNTYYVSDSVSMFRDNAKNFLADAVNGQVFSSRI